MKKILAIIPARSGSKSVPHKNIRSVAGKPLIAWTIEQAKKSNLIDRIIVSTDSKEYAAIAQSFGAEVPFIRPKYLSSDYSTDLEVFKHTLDWLSQNENYIPDYCVHLRPTCPVREDGQIDMVIQKLLESPEADSIKTIVEAPHTPYKMWKIKDKNYQINPILNDSGIDEPYNEPRQKLPKTYLQTANIDVVKSSVITNKQSMSGDIIIGFIEQEFNDIDSLDELENVIRTLSTENFSEAARNNETICFDIDGVIATLSPNNDYTKADCNSDVVELIRQLKKMGFKIVLNTARGSQTGIDWREITKNQMQEWGVEYDELYLGKPAAIYYIDDRLISINNLKRMINHTNN